MSRTPYGLWFPGVDPISVFSLLHKFGGYVSLSWIYALLKTHKLSTETAWTRTKAQR